MAHKQGIPGGWQGGSTNRSFASTDPERQREHGRPAERAAQENSAGQQPLPHEPRPPGAAGGDASGASRGSVGANLGGNQGHHGGEGSSR